MLCTDRVCISTMSVADSRLGHGSNVQGLETTATYIPYTDEFEINSPTLTVFPTWRTNRRLRNGGSEDSE